MSYKKCTIYVVPVTVIILALHFWSPFISTNQDSILYSLLPLLGFAITLTTVTLMLLSWVKGSRIRRLSKHFVGRTTSTLPKDLLDALSVGLMLPADIVSFFSNDDTIMSIYLLMYPEHCMYDSQELDTVLSELEKRYSLKHNQTLLNLPLHDLAQRISTSNNSKSSISGK